MVLNSFLSKRLSFHLYAQLTCLELFAKYQKRNWKILVSISSVKPVVVNEKEIRAIVLKEINYLSNFI